MKICYFFKMGLCLAAHQYAINNLFSFGVELTTIEDAVFEDPKLKGIQNQWLLLLFYKIYHRQYLKDILIFNIQSASFTISADGYLMVYLEIHMALNNVIRVLKVDQKFPCPKDLSDKDLQTLKLKISKVLRLKVMKEFNKIEKHVKKLRATKINQEELDEFSKSIIILPNTTQQNNIINSSLQNTNLRVESSNEEQKVSPDSKTKDIQNNTARIWPSGTEANDLGYIQDFEGNRDFGEGLDITDKIVDYPQNA